MLKQAVAALAISAVAVVGQAVPATAHAEVSAGCWAHLASIPPGETPAGDRRYHLMHGEQSPCTEQETTEASDKPREESHKEKSRHCKHAWYC